ncbi:MAG: hypothetical protein NC342_03910 [Pseudoflavonifractor sp.]|nr:hypothetical protein [Alloprevotella sp.]MCM1116660.1 hypothetical protein [Pseudoflavonifractor sp.]
MSNAVTKLTTILALSATLMGAPSCSSDDEAAKALRDQAAAAIEASDPAGAIILLDSLDNTYAGATNIRRDAMRLRPKAIELLTLRELEVNDSLTAATKVAIDEITPLLTFKQPTAGIDGYYVAKEMKDAIPSSAEGLYARMSPEGHFYVISSARKGCLSKAIAVSAGGEEKAETPPVDFDGARNDRSMKAETITFIPSECDTIGSFILNNAHKPITLSIIGEKSSQSMVLPAKQTTAIATLYAASRIYRRASALARQKQALEQRLMLSRSQQARLTPD